MPAKKLEGVTNPLDLFRKQFSEVVAPKGGLPTMPTRIADIASDELGNMIARYTAWREFTEDRHLEACATYAQIKSECDLEMDRVMVGNRRMSATEKKATARLKLDESGLLRKLEEAEIYRDLLSGKLDSFSNVLAMLSRELTRRGVFNS